MGELRERMNHINTEAIRAGEMRQGCTSHSFYAEKLTEHQLSEVRAEIEKCGLTDEDLMKAIDVGWLPYRGGEDLDDRQLKIERGKAVTQAMKVKMLEALK